MTKTEGLPSENASGAENQQEILNFEEAKKIIEEMNRAVSNLRSGLENLNETLAVGSFSRERMKVSFAKEISQNLNDLSEQKEKLERLI